MGEHRGLENYSPFIFSKDTYPKVKDICTPLFSNFKITSFNYTKFFSNGTILRLSTHEQWTKYYFEHRLYDSDFSYHRITQLNPHSDYKMLLWNANTTHQMLHAHDIYHIFQIFEQEVDGLVCYYFSTTKENMQIVDWYLNHIDLLKHFIFYFKDKAHDLIEVNDRKKLIETKFASHTLSHTENESIKKFFEETTIKRYYLSGAYKDIYLSKREFDCAHYLMDGYSSKLIARHLNLSPRTVESYINQVKAKLNCRTKNQIIKILLDAKEERYLIHS